MKFFFGDFHPPERPRKSFKVNLIDVQFPGNKFELSVILNDFRSLKISAIQNPVSFIEFVNVKNPDIQPNYRDIVEKLKYILGVVSYDKHGSCDRKSYLL